MAIIIPGAGLQGGGDIKSQSREISISDGGVGTTQLADNSVTYAKLQEISAQFRALGRNSSGAGVVEEVTLSQLLDWIGSAAQGDILFRGASAWERLAAGTDGQILQTQGSGANPQWVDPAVALLDSGTVTNQATLDIILTAYTAYRKLELELINFVPATDDAELWCRFSTDGGSSYDATGYSFTMAWSSDDNPANFGNLLSAAANQIRIAGHTTANYSVSNVASEGGADVKIDILGRTTARFTRIRYVGGYYTANQVGATLSGSGLREAAQDTDAMRVLFETGNIASGDWILRGYL